MNLFPIAVILTHKFYQPFGEQLGAILLGLFEKIPSLLDRQEVYWFCALSGTSLLAIQIGIELDRLR